MPPHFQRRPQRRRAGHDPATPVTFSPRGSGSGPQTPELPQPRVRRRGWAEGETAGYLPFSPSLPASRRPSRLRRSPGHLPLCSSHWVQVLAPGTLAGEGPRGGAQGSRGEGGDKPSPQNSKSRCAPILPGANQTQAPPLLFANVPARRGGWRDASPAPLPAAPNSDVHCATQGPRYRVPALSYKSQGASRHPGADGTPAHPLKGAATPPGSVCGDGVRERGSGCFLRHGTHPVSVPAPRAVPSPAKGCGIAAYLSSLGLPAQESRTQDARRSEYPGERCAGFGLEALSLRSCPKFDPSGSWASSLESSLPRASFWAGCTPPRGLPFSPLRHGPFGS